MSYYWFNRQKILRKAKERYCKGKGAEYYLKNKEVIEEKSRERLKTCHKKKNIRLKSTKEKNIKNWFSKYFFVLSLI